MQTPCHGLCFFNCVLSNYQKSINSNQKKNKGFFFSVLFISVNSNSNWVLWVGNLFRFITQITQHTTINGENVNLFTNIQQRECNMRFLLCTAIISPD